MKQAVHHSLSGSKPAALPGGILALLLSLYLGPSAFAQGPLTPTGVPQPTMKSLQEIWDRIGVLETQNQTLQSTINSQQAQISLLQKSSATVLHYASGGSLPWSLSTVDSAGNVGIYTSLAFGPDGQPAISYQDRLPNNDLKFARFNGSTWSLTTVDSAGFVGYYTSLAFGPDGQPAISYQDGSNGDLKLARMGAFTPGP